MLVPSHGRTVGCSCWSARDADASSSYEEPGDVTDKDDAADDEVSFDGANRAAHQAPFHVM